MFVRILETLLRNVVGNIIIGFALVFFIGLVITIAFEMKTVYATVGLLIVLSYCVGSILRGT